MIEVATYYDLRAGIDLKKYRAWSNHVIDTILKAPGLVEFRAARNAGGSPQVRSTTVWRTLGDWANFNESTEWINIDAELRNKFGVNVNFIIWRPSPIVPKSLKPKRK